MDFSNTLINWYLQNKRFLPWRKTNNPYAIWLSEIILQQTRIEQGLSYYIKFLTHFPTVFDLARADEQTVLKLWQGLGYYSRARNLHFSAKYIVRELDGEFPSTYQNILKLKGVGDYTASAIASICFKEPCAVVDGNVYRVLARYFGVKTAINSTKGVKQFKELAQTLIDNKQPGTFNQAVMDFGAQQCKPQNPDCQICPLHTSCVAFEKKLVSILPVKEKKRTIKNRYFNFLVVESKGKTVLEKRTSKGIWQNLYQFPLVESKTLLSYEQLIKDSTFTTMFKEAQVTVKEFNYEPIVHKLSHQHLYTKFWIIQTDGPLKNLISWQEFKNYPVPILIHNFAEKYLKL